MASVNYSAIADEEAFNGEMRIELQKQAAELA